MEEIKKEEYINKTNSFNKLWADEGYINTQAKLEIIAYQININNTGNAPEERTVLEIISKYLRKIPLKEELNDFDRLMIRTVDIAFDMYDSNKFSSE